jgi:hypothetical protein
MLHTLTLIEGEGLGMAYEYFVRRRLLLNWYQPQPRPQRLLIAGLPEKHGFAFDFFLLAQEWSAELVVADERPQRLEKCQRLVAAAQHQGYFHNLTPTYLPVTDLIHLPELQQTFDLALSAELLQRIPSEWVPRYWRTLCQRAKAIALFAPNADNPAHQLYSHIPGLYLDDMRTIALMAHKSEVRIGYLDVPPFPPGIGRPSSSHEQAAAGLFDNLGIWLLELYARLEPYFSQRWNRGRAHTVYALATSTK